LRDSLIETAKPRRHQLFPQNLTNMELHRIHTSESSVEVRWLLDLIELGQPSMRLILPGDAQHEYVSPINLSSSASEYESDDGRAQEPTEGLDVPAERLASTDANIERDTDAAKLENAGQSSIVNRSILLVWWEEILSISIAIICTALSVAVLIYMNNRSLSKWTYRLQPNTLVAFLATITRAALIYALAECLGHLKWTYSERPKALIHFHTFNAASRGPLGGTRIPLEIAGPLTFGVICGCGDRTVVAIPAFRPTKY